MRTRVAGGTLWERRLRREAFHPAFAPQAALLQRATEIEHHRPMRPDTLPLTLAALVAFAANSILCRLALASGTVDAASFTTIRIASGALLLALLLRWRGGSAPAGTGPRAWWPAAMLFGYAIAFSYAYRSLSAGTGALILFGAVQTTMLLAGWRSGERLAARQWLGIAAALAGLVWLVSPGLAAPDPVGAALMGAAGVAWGAYSLLGRGAGDPVAATATNFLRAVPMALAVSALAVAHAHVSTRGAVLAMASGAIASGLGYVAWYAALRGLAASQAAVVQLAVPVLAATAGVALLGEALTLRLVGAGTVILGGIALAMARRSPD
jgi:drug/metabolite transporter (DMT)-like permease